MFFRVSFRLSVFTALSCRLWVFPRYFPSSVHPRYLPSYLFTCAILPVTYFPTLDLPVIRFPALSCQSSVFPRFLAGYLFSRAFLPVMCLPARVCIGYYAQNYARLEVKCSNYAGLKRHFYPTPIRSYLLTNIPSQSEA